MAEIKIDDIIDVAKAAGEVILEVYHSADTEVEYKSDQSPLTLADKRAHTVIAEHLQALYPDIPQISEEGESVDWRQRQSFRCYWLIDPLDGTKEFVKRNGEFTVNIALVEDGIPTLGVVYVPVTDVLYYGDRAAGAFKKQRDQAPQAIHVAGEPGEVWRVVGSRSHAGEALSEFLKQLPEHDIVPVGSSLKLCLVAEGEADIYPRLGPTSEWDTAAAQAVVEAAGGVVVEFETLQPLRYNQKESILNPEFLVCSKPGLEAVKAKRNADVVWHPMEVNKRARAQRFQQKPAIVWFTGLSGSGKSTSASALEQQLFAMGYATYLLDGDNVRHGLCADLGFTERDRGENIRRVGEVAKLLVDSGQIVLVSFISPFLRERKMVRQMVEPGEFVEVYVNTPLQECEKRDPKGLYQKARSGQIKNFTGIDSAYEPPVGAEIEIDTSEKSVDEIVQYLVEHLQKHQVI